MFISVEGRPFPVDSHYLKTPTHDYIQTAVDMVMEIHKHENPGDVLVFLTGAEEIDTAVELIKERAATCAILVLSFVVCVCECVCVF